MNFNPHTHIKMSQNGTQTHSHSHFSSRDNRIQTGPGAQFSKNGIQAATQITSWIHYHGFSVQKHLSSFTEKRINPGLYHNSGTGLFDGAPVDFGRPLSTHSGHISPSDELE
ncbi:hypothetical protein RSOL_411930 [Rhizoctonia solani AG-3 Rhs1AP]|uniref:Uncharacterized protein n=2 Tax=Rhizoctonia solani AG-3 TaxID=1086053 RepID=A0A074S5X2_9AGAM|nr:hypothetical protein RSOL_411930 [Rhizoctonia solani AG-3 Rhs1AP]KEP53010.1 hypothetical protein V565_036650 [Rhizoctonia solani 123E]